MHRAIKFSASMVMLAISATAAATTYPVTLTDFDGQKITLSFAELQPVKAGRFYGVYHNFYNHPWNLVGIEYLAKFIYPQQFAQLDPTESWHEIVTRFTTIPEGKGVLGSQAARA